MARRQSNANPNAIRGRHSLRLLPRLNNSAKPKVPDSATQNANGLLLGGPPVGCVRPADVPVVTTARLTVPPPVTELGVTLQVEDAGIPPQLSSTVWLKLLSGETVME
jgi:hypothetical protein